MWYSWGENNRLFMDTKAKIGVVVVGKDGRVLLIKEKLEKKPVALWNIIKGSYDGGETVFEAARRECKEEASLDVVLTHTLGAYISEEPEKIRIQFNFLAEANDMNVEVASREDQKSRNEVIVEVWWFTKEEVVKMNPEDFVSARTFELLQDWIAGKTFPLEAYKQVEM